MLDALPDRVNALEAIDWLTAKRSVAALDTGLMPDASAKAGTQPYLY